VTAARATRAIAATVGVDDWVRRLIEAVSAGWSVKEAEGVEVNLIVAVGFGFEMGEAVGVVVGLSIG